MAKKKKQRNHGAGSLYLRGPVWWMAFSWNGKRISESCKTDKKMVAQGKLIARLNSVNQNTFVHDQNSVTVADIFELVRADYAEHHPRSLNTLVYSRWNPKRNPTNRTTLYSFFAPLKAVRLVDTDLLKQYRDRRKAEMQAKYPKEAEAASKTKTGAMKGYETINKELDVLRLAFQLAIEKKMLVRGPSFRKLRLPEKKREGFVKDNSYQGLVGACTQVGGLWLKCAFEIAYTYGWRASEIRNLKVDNVDLLDRQLILHPSETKTEKGKIAPIKSDVLFQLVSECIKGKGKGDYVFTRPNGSHVSYYSFRAAWLKVCVLTGNQGLYFHDLRRSALSNAVKRGMPKKTAMTMSGHQTESVFNRYTIIEAEDVAAGVEMVERKRAENLQQLQNSYSDPENSTKPTQNKQLPN